MTESGNQSLSGEMSYGDYLGLDQLLSAQHPLSKEHDELLFIIIHQAKELWLKLFNHELDAAIENIRTDQLQPAFKCLARAGRIQEQLIQAWSVLTTMTPADYLKFRPYLGRSSGFQSWQYRMIEFKLGAKNAQMLEPHRHRLDIVAQLQHALDAPSIYDETFRLLKRRGFAVPDAVLSRPPSEPHTANQEIEQIWLEIYRNSERYFDLYELAEELVDIEDSFQQWRFRHMKTVERIIGMRPGTGGSSGVGYLKSVLQNSFFPELWSVRTIV